MVLYLLIYLRNLDRLLECRFKFWVHFPSITKKESGHCINLFGSRTPTVIIRQFTTLTIGQAFPFFDHVSSFSCNPSKTRNRGAQAWLRAHACIFLNFCLPY